VRSKRDLPVPNTEAGTAAAPGGSAPARLGRLAPGSTPGALLVDFDGNTGGAPRAARSIVVLDEQALRQAIALRQSVVLLFENGDAALPIVVGLVPVAPGAALLGPLLAPQHAAPPAPAVTERIEAHVDGKRVVLEGQDEVVLKCGEASITLKRDGKLILRGAHVETHAKGVNRIKGGSVKIN
jgi:hypothetical protein